ncbi:hypothetical protein EON64_20435 [archaeon]|nr:MAG: hypothetical protein EON64_20435 [archaeon]
MARPAVPAVSRMSSLIERKEHAEEARFIRSMEQKNKEDLKANMERILALEDHHEDKKELLELLGKLFHHFNILDSLLDLPLFKTPRL